VFFLEIITTMCHAIKKLLFKFGYARKAGVALEFAIVSPLFLGLIIAIIQVSLNYFVQSMVDRLSNSTALYLRSGVPQIAGMNGSTFQSQVLCTLASPILNCNNILYRIWTNKNPRVIGTWIFSAYGFAIPWCTVNVLRYYTQSGAIPYCNKPSTSTELFCPGGPTASIMVQIAYPIPFSSFIWSGNGLTNAYFLSTQISVNDDYGITYSNPTGC
jgi:TadE-like protein